MRILADENFPRPVVESLRNRDHDVIWARTDCPGLKDRALLERAEAEGRVVMTLDKDFWQIALQRSIPLKRSGVILPSVSGDSRKPGATRGFNSSRRTVVDWAGQHCHEGRHRNDPDCATPVLKSRLGLDLSWRTNCKTVCQLETAKLAEFE